MFFFALRYLHRLVFETARTNYFPYLKTSCVLEDFLAFFKTFFLPVIFIQLKLRRPRAGISYLFRRMFLSEFKEILHKDITGKNNPSKIRTTFPIARTIEFLFQYTFNCQLEVKSVVVNSKKTSASCIFLQTFHGLFKRAITGRGESFMLYSKQLLQQKSHFIHRGSIPHCT